MWQNKFICGFLDGLFILFDDGPDAVQEKLSSVLDMAEFCKSYEYKICLKKLFSGSGMPI